jgi:hypothetical protein
MHLHEVAHYYLGSKYFDELEYGRLYVALARAELEDHGEPLQVAEARDLSTNAIVPIREILSRGDEVRGRFTPERWADFRKDADFLRDALASSYGTVLKDHGFNPSPLWALLGGFLANRVPAGSPTGIFVLTLLDPLLLVTAFVAVGLSFGLDAALLTISYFTVIFGASFGWIGGAYLRYLWFAAVILGACFLKKEMYRRSGALLAFASGLRIFPSLLIAGLGLKATREFLHDGHIPVRYVRFFTSFLATATILFATTLLMSGGLSNWAGFQQNMGVHVENAGSNLVGLTSLIAYLRSVDLTAPNALEALTEFRRASVHLQLVAMLPVVLLFVTLLCSRVPDFAALALGIPLIITTLNLSAYYYSFLLLLLLAHMKQPLKVAMIFGVEASMYVLQLFEQHDAVLYVYRGILLLYLVAATHLDLLTVELREVWAARPSFLRSSLAR